MDYLKASDMYKAIKVSRAEKPSEVFGVINNEKIKDKRSYARSPRRAWYRTKEKNIEAAILIGIGAMFLLLALAGPREVDRIFGSICVFVTLVFGVLV